MVAMALGVPIRHAPSAANESISSNFTLTLH
jgi:hypothetical protein